MYHRGRGGNRKGRGSKGPSATRVPLKGLFSDGVWKCNCDPRLPAQHFQTKNGGKNHGRWFYTCQHPQPKRCDFFLWGDEAKGREAAAVLNNSRTEPVPPAPATPSKPLPSTGLTTPQTGDRYTGWNMEEVQTPYTKDSMNVDRTTMTRAKNETQTTATILNESDEEFFDWPASDAEELGKAADEVLGNQSSSALKEMRRPLPPPSLTETPRKAIKTDALTTPGKRRYEEMEAPIRNAYPAPAVGLHGDDVFATPSNTGLKATGRGLFANTDSKANGTNNSPPETPTPIRYRDVPPGAPSELASEILATLSAHTITLPIDAKQAVTGICNRHVLYTRGITKGRDVSRATVKTKSEKIVEMQAEMEALKSERETNRAVIRHLRRDMAQRKEVKG